VADDLEWFVWNLFKGGVETASIAETRKDKYNTSAHLGGPYHAKIGWFNLDDLEKNGRIEVSGYVVLSPERWALDREALYEKLSKTKFTTLFGASSSADVKHRRVLNLPRQGPLSKSEIEYAYRIAAKNSHPDGGGSEEKFRPVSEAKVALLLRASDALFNGDT
jgi:hypothetical protein